MVPPSEQIAAPGRPTVSENPTGRMTRQKRAVAAVLQGTEEFSSAQELHARLKAPGRAGRAGHGLQPAPRPGRHGRG